MTTMYEKIRALYNKYVTDFLDSKQRDDTKLYPEKGRLILPGDEDGEESKEGNQYSKMFEEMGESGVGMSEYLDMEEVKNNNASQNRQIEEQQSKLDDN